MNAIVEPHIAAAKVIAAGGMSDDWLRATIMLTPLYSADSVESLKHWPSQMINWLRSTNFTLKLLVCPVTYAGAGGDCVALPKSNISLIDAEASAMKATWRDHSDGAWVDELWANAFDAKKNPNNWSLLAKFIVDSSKGETLAKGKTGMAGSKTIPDITAGTLRQSPVSGNDKTATLDWILPSRHTELSLLLEYKRAMELCDTAVHAFDPQKDIRKEIDCSKIAQLRPGDPKQNAQSLQLKELFDAAIAQYDSANESAKNFYSEKACGPQTGQATATTHSDSLGGAQREDLEKALHDPIDSYQAASQPQQYCDGQENPYTQTDALSQIFYSLQASPTFSRLFGLTLDVRFRAGRLTEILRDASKLADGGHFLYLSLNSGSVASNALGCTIYTFAKYRPGPSPQHFWPASRAEVGLGVSPEPERLFDLAQYEGVMLAGRRLDTPRGLVSRFELSSLDVRSACEAALDRRAVDLTEEELKQQCASASPAQRPAAIARKTYTTAGLVILDRGRQQQAVSQFAARNAHQQRVQSNTPAPPSSEPVDPVSERFMVLDAEDLTIGYRIDVGVPLRGHQPNYAWRGLMARNVKYGINNGLHARRVRSVAEGLFLEDISRKPIDPDIGWRQCLEDGLLALTARLIPRTDDPGAPVDAYVEEAIGTWAGEPMSVLCAGKRTEKVKLLDGLPSGCVVSAPTSRKDPHRRTPALRFGWPYRVGLRAVYSGGISIPLGVAANLYDLDRTAKFPLGRSMTIPAVPAMPKKQDAQEQVDVSPVRRRDQLRRFLRHERVDAPFLLLPEDVALRRHGPMGYERAAHAVIRTTRGNVRDRESPTVTQRVFVAPSVSQSFAAMHGVFDRTDVQHPAQGLSSTRFGRSGVRFDAESGGFPIVTSNYIVGFNGVPYLSSRQVSIQTHGENSDKGELVYSTAPPKVQRKTPYYPDPAINAYVVGVRVAGSNTYLDGGPCVISACGNGYSYPDVRPLSVTVERKRNPEKKRRSAYPKLEDVLSWPKTGSNGRLSSQTAGATRIPGAVETRLTLSPGDDFEVDVWCIPDDIGLAKRFAIVESIGSLAMARAKIKQSDSKTPIRESVCNSLKELLPKTVCEITDACLPGAAATEEFLQDWSEGCAGPGGLPTLGPESISAIGRALYDALTRRPLDEIAAVRTLRVTHATDQPLLHPVFVPAGNGKTHYGPEPLLRLRRMDPTKDEPHRYTAIGDVLIHLATTGCLEVSADMASPSSDRFDDVRRARAFLDRRMGTWPKRENGSLMPPGQIFGFDVSATGEVSLPKTKNVVLYRLDDIPLPRPQTFTPTNNEQSRISLEKLFCIRGKDPDYGTGKPTHQFSDGLARLLDLRVTAYSRHSDQMRTASAPARNGKWLRDGEPLAPKDSSVQSSSVSAWLDASVRPAEPAARTPIPAFLWTTDPEKRMAGERIRRLTRRTVIRIPLARPWFSSGEDERLGLVLWPPDLFGQDPTQFAQDIVAISAKPNQNSRLMHLEDFHDEDLGPGGKFVTRWGGDPTRIPAGTPSEVTAPRAPYRRSFIPAQAFLDKFGETGTGFKAEFVPNVSMPIRVQENSAPTSDSEAGAPPTLEVSLLTFQPKFDVFDEEWYVDVAIEHDLEAEPFLRLGLVRYQPHAPAHLQVSYPAIQWTQLLPRRSVEVRRSKHEVAVLVEGLATSPPSVFQPDEDSDKERPAAPRMTARIVKEFDLNPGVPMRRVLIEETFGAGNITYPQGTDAAYYAMWKLKLPLNATIEKDSLGRSKYFVIIEEGEARLPATYPTEPVGPKKAIGRECGGQFLEEVLVESGPRFFAKIPL